MAASKQKTGAIYQAPAVDKALDILEHLSAQQNGVTMKELTHALNRSMSEIYRVALALERRHFIYKDPESDRLFLSLRLFELANRYPPTTRLVRAALPIMEDLAERSSQSCHLGVLDGERLIVLASVSSPLPMHYGVNMGSSFPILETSSGVLLMAFARRQRIDLGLASLEPSERKSYQARFEDIRRTGREIRESEVVHGVVNLACAVRDHSRGVIAALTVPYLKQLGAVPGEKEVADDLVKSASLISQAMGGCDDGT